MGLTALGIPLAYPIPHTSPLQQQLAQLVLPLLVTCPLPCTNVLLGAIVDAFTPVVPVPNLEDVAGHRLDEVAARKFIRHLLF